MKKIYWIFVLCLLPACFDNKKNKAHKVSVIVFDFDGTLADSLALAIKCINQLSSQYGYKPLEEARDIERFRESRMHEVMSKYLGLKFYQFPSYTRQFKNFFNENLKDVNVFDGIKELLQTLATKYDLVVISSNSDKAIRKTLEKGGIVSIIKYIDSDSSIFGKHVVIKRFLKTHNLNPDEIIYIGDEIRDVDACKKIGVKVIAVTWGYNSKSALEESKPDYLVDTCAEIEKIMAVI